MRTPSIRDEPCVQLYLWFSSTTNNKFIDEPGASVPQEGQGDDEGQAEIVQENVQFQETVDIVSAGHEAPEVAPTSVKRPVDFDRESLKEWLSRPIKMATVTWSAVAVRNSVIYQSFEPYETLIRSVYGRKLEGFALFRGNLHVRFMVNGGAFHNGQLIATWWPFKSQSSYDTQSNLTRKSMLPHVYISPSINESHELVIPFATPNNYISLTEPDMGGLAFPEQLASNLGSLEVTVFNRLRLLDLLVDTEVDVTMSCWFTDVDVRIPTDRQFQPQSQKQSSGMKGKTVTSSKKQSGAPPSNRDEHKEPGVVEDIATKVGAAAGYLKDVPVIGSFASATQGVAGVVGKVANIFGFSKPPFLDDVPFYVPSVIGNISSAAGKDNAVTLALDPKQEVTIDPGVVGLESKDSMSLREIFERESLILQATWSSEDSPLTQLMTVDVTPMVTVPVDLTDPQEPVMQMPAITHGTLAFTYWTGSLTYRLQLVGSQLHRGRIRIVYTPRNVTGLLPNSDEWPYTFSRIIDLAGMTETTFTIEWCQPFMWSTVQPHPTNQQTNGFLSIEVLNSLRAADSLDATEIELNLFLMGGPDYKVAVPQDRFVRGALARPKGTAWTGYENQFADGNNLFNGPPEWTAYQGIEYQSKVEGHALFGDKLETVGSPGESILAHGYGDNEHYEETSIGEAFASVRQLLKRYQPYLKMTAPIAVSAFFEIPSKVTDMRYAVLDDQSMTGIAGWQSYSNYFNYFAPSYVFQRGGMRLRAVYNGINAWDNGTSWRDLTISYIPTPSGHGFRTFLGLPNSSYFDSSSNGLSLGQQVVNSAVHVQVPWYSRFATTLAGQFGSFLFYPQERRETDFGDNGQCGRVRFLVVGDTDENPRGHKTIDVAVASSEDFQYDWYIGPPPMKFTAGLPTVT